MFIPSFLGSVQTKEKNHINHIIVVVFWVMGPMIFKSCATPFKTVAGLKNRTPPQKKS